MKLISMTDFVLEQEKSIPNELNTSPMKDCDRLFVKRIISYQRFLKQSLTIGMFVPCDEDGNVLDQPLPSDYDNYDLIYGGNVVDYESFGNALDVYKKAKEKVLFEGFVYNPEEEWLEIVEPDNGLWTIYPSYLIKNTVEDMIQCDMTLTESAIKQIGL